MHFGEADVRDRVKGAAGVGLLHALLGYAFIAGLGMHFPASVSEPLKLFDVSRLPPPPAVEESASTPTPDDRAEGEAAPPALEARSSPVEAKPPEIRLNVPPPLAAAPEPGTGSQTSAGASTEIGPGSGAGGIGDGSGSGGTGRGGGGGAVAAGARQIAGAIVNRDYPRSARRMEAQGTVNVHFEVGTNGRVSGCSVTRSSGHAELDETTCRLIRKRFRFIPARDASGRPVADQFDWVQRWWISPNDRFARY